VTDAAVFVIDDDRQTADTIRLYLEAAGYPVEVFYDGRRALDRLGEREPAAVIVDVMLPGLDGLTLCRELRRTSRVPILIVSARTEEADRLIGLNLGADDYLTKPFSPRELVARLRAVLRRIEPPTGPAGLAVDARTHEMRFEGRPLPLTATEFRILRLFAESPGRVFTRDDIIRLALGADFEGLDRTVDAHIMNVRRKVRTVGGPTDIIATVFGVGYKLGLG
jgi:two-component system response regulator BaeR